MSSNSSAAIPVLAETPRRIALFRALHLGDLLCAVPALRALREAAPQAHITLIGLPWTASFADRYRHYVDDWLEYPLGEDLPAATDGEPRLRSFLTQARAAKFDLVIQLHGSGDRSNALVSALGARRVAGFHPAAQAPDDAAALIPWRDDEGEIARWLRLMRHLGAENRDGTIDLPVLPPERCECALLLAKAGLAGRRYICVHAGARLPSRRWPLERFRAVTETFADEGYAIVLTGSAAEIAQNNGLREGLRLPAGAVLADFAGRTSIGALAQIVAGAELLIANDTGISHVAAAVGTPSIIVSSGGDAKRWAPLRSDLHQVLGHEMSCRPCAYHDCPYRDHPCAQAVDVDAVVVAAHQLLRNGVRNVA